MIAELQEVLSNELQEATANLARMRREHTELKFRHQKVLDSNAALRREITMLKKRAARAVRFLLNP